jgi:hypothetical protein
MREKRSAPTSLTVRFSVEPRLVPPQKAARRLSLSLSAFSFRLPDLQQTGFPKPCPVLGHYDIHAIDAWIDDLPAQSLAEVDDDFEARLARLDRKAKPR